MLEPKETKKIFSRKFALELRRQGFKILATEPNIFKPELDVYIFQESEQLETELRRLIDERN